LAQQGEAFPFVDEFFDFAPSKTERPVSDPNDRQVRALASLIDRNDGCGQIIIWGLGLIAAVRLARGERWDKVRSFGAKRLYDVHARGPNRWQHRGSDSDHQQYESGNNYGQEAG
jgi:hypothetical protein